MPRILGLDPGTAITGYAVIEATAWDPESIAFGVIRTKSNLPLSERLLRIHATCRELIKLHRPDRVAVEQIFFNRNVQSALSVGQARGVILLAAAEAGLEVDEFTPPEVKAQVVGYGQAEKHQVQAMVQRILRLPKLPEPDDAADALAIALCGLYRIHGSDDSAGASISNSGSLLQDVERGVRGGTVW